MTETRDESVTWLTQEAYDRLKAELDYLSGPGRADIAKKIEAAREGGDLRENGGYHAAKDEQGQMEARIVTLQHILENARVGVHGHEPKLASQQKSPSCKPSVAPTPVGQHGIPGRVSFRI